MKRFFIFLFIISTQMPFTLTKLVLYWQKKAVRKEVKKRINDGLKDDQLVKLTFFKPDIHKLLKWTKKDEFDLNGQMYDIVRSWESNDSIIFMCWEDDDESIIKQRLNQLSELEWSKNKSNKSQNERKSDFYKTLICPEQPIQQQKWQFKPFHTTVKISYVISLYIPHFLPPISPPPETKMNIIFS